MDPLAEKYCRWSPYNCCVNNPMRFIDPDGMNENYYNLNGEKIANDLLNRRDQLVLTENAEKELYSSTVDITNGIPDVIMNGQCDVIVDAPTNTEMTGFDKVYSDTEANNTNECAMVSSKDGSLTAVTTKDSPGTVNPGPSYQSLSKEGVNSYGYEAHSHGANGDLTSNNLIEVSVPYPSSKDMNTVRPTATKVILGYDIKSSITNDDKAKIRNAGGTTVPLNSSNYTKIITFYNSKSTIISIPYNKFKDTVDLINSK